MLSCIAKLYVEGKYTAFQSLINLGIIQSDGYYNDMYQYSADYMWRQQKQSMTDRQMDRQSDPYVVLCFAGATKMKTIEYILVKISMPM